MGFDKIVASGCEKTGLFYFTLQIPVYKSAVVWEGSKFRHIVMDSKLAPFSCHLSFLPNSACYHEVGSVLCKCNRKINPTTLYVVFPKPRIITEGVFYSLNNLLFVICMDKNRWQIIGLRMYSFGRESISWRASFESHSSSDLKPSSLGAAGGW